MSDGTFERYRYSLAEYAFDPVHSKGRRNPDPTDLLEVFDPFHNDLLTMGCSSMLRHRLRGKTQVLGVLMKRPETSERLSHTGNVEDIADQIAAYLGQNRSLSRAIARLHDCGYPPGGRPGADTITLLAGQRFSHAHFAPVVAQEILNLNLSYEVLHGATYHSSGSRPLMFTDHLALEYGIVRASDTLAHSLIDNPPDAVAEGLIRETDFPDCYHHLGATTKERVQRCIVALAAESVEATRRNGAPQISFFQSEVARDFSAFNKWMYEKVYLPLNDKEWRLKFAEHMKSVYQLLVDSPVFQRVNCAVVLALMTDHEVQTLVTEFCDPDGKPKCTIRSLSQLPPLGFKDFIPMIEGRNISFTADLSWADARPR